LRRKFSLLKNLLPAIVWAIFILVLTTLSNGGFVSQNLLGIATDKLGHAFIFGVLVFFIMQALIKLWRFSFFLRKIQIIAFFIGVGYGCLIELIQLYIVTYRQAEWGDVMANIIGCFIGLIMFNSVYGNLKFLDKE